MYTWPTKQEFWIMSHFEGRLNQRLWRYEKVLQLVQIGGRGGGNLEKIQKNSNLFSWNHPLTPSPSLPTMSIWKQHISKGSFPNRPSYLLKITLQERILSSIKHTIFSCFRATWPNDNWRNEVWRPCRPTKKRHISVLVGREDEACFLLAHRY